MNSDSRTPMQTAMRTFAAVALALSLAAHAAYPERPIRILLTTAPGAAIDITARLVAEHMSKTLKQQVVVENQPGGAGNVALGQVANAHADGYTLVMSATTYVAAPFLFTRIPYDPVKSFIPVSQLVTFNNVIVTSPQYPAKTIAEFIANAKANPEAVSVGGGNLGGQSWIMTMKLNTMAGITLNYIAYKGSGPALVDAMGGHVNAVLSDPASIKSLVADGKLRPLAVTSQKRTKSFPDVPAIGEVVPGYEQEGWVGLFAPAGTPREVVQVLNTAVKQALADPAIHQRLVDGDFGVVGSTPEEFAAIINRDLAVYGKTIAAAGIKPE